MQFHTESAARLAVALVVVCAAPFVGAQVVTTRQVSTVDVIPTLISQTDASLGNDPFAPVPFLGNLHYTQLFTPSVDNGSLAFTASAHQDFYRSDLPFRNALFVIDDLVPSLTFGDGTTNVNVQTLGHGSIDSSTGVWTNLPGASGFVAFDESPNGFSFDQGNLSATYREQGDNNFGILEGAPPTEMSTPVTPHQVVFDPGVTLFSGFETFGPEQLPSGFPSAAVSRDGDRTIYSASLLETGSGGGFRHVLQVHETGVGTTTLAVSPVLNNAVGSPPSTDDGNEIDLPNSVAYQGAQYISADGGQFVIATRDDRVYLFDASNNATLLATGNSLDHITLDGGDVVVGRGTGLANSEVRSFSTRHRDFFANSQADSNSAISRIEQGSFVDLVNTSTLIPDTDQTFHSFGTFSYSDGNLAFLATGSDDSDIAGLFVLYEDVVHEVVLLDELFDGKTVTEVDLHREGLDGDTLAFVVTFDEPTGLTDTLNQSIYTLSLSDNFVPEPSSLALLGLGVLRLIARRR